MKNTINQFELKNQKSAGGLHEVQLYKLTSTNEEWFLKRSSNGEIILEYFAAKLYKYFLGDSAPEVILIIDENKKIILGSKKIDNFVSLYDIVDFDWNTEKNTYEEFLKMYDSEFDKTLLNGRYFCSIYNDKPVYDFEKVWLVSIFIGELDYTTSNFGFRKEHNGYYVSKIDHDQSLYFLFEVGLVDIIVGSLGRLSNKLRLHPKNAIKALNTIASIDIQELNKIIDTSAEELQIYFSDDDLAAAFSELSLIKKTHDKELFESKNFDQFKNNLKNALCKRMVQFEKTLQDLKNYQQCKSNDEEGNLTPNNHRDRILKSKDDAKTINYLG